MSTHIEGDETVVQSLLKEIQALEQKLTEEPKQVDLNFNIVDLIKMDLELGDVLIVKAKGPDFENEEVLQSLQEQLKIVFPHNKVLCLHLGDNELNLEVVKQPESEGSSSGSVCSDCSCGKANN